MASAKQRAAAQRNIRKAHAAKRLKAEQRITEERERRESEIGDLIVKRAHAVHAYEALTGDGIIDQGPRLQTTILQTGARIRTLQEAS